MRNPARLNPFYSQLCQAHQSFFPDWRFGQLMLNFLAWVQTQKHRDPFFPEEAEMLSLLHEYCQQTAKLS